MSSSRPWGKAHRVQGVGSALARARRLPALWCCALLLGAGCRERATNEAPAKFAPCREVGQRCEYSPGKLGSCVVLDNCTKSDCFVCQSQH